MPEYGRGATSSPDLSPGPPTRLDTNPKRRRASRKGQARAFPCTWNGCGKRYTRQEHLLRHQLNHRPKEVYRCDVEGCNSTFVRSDLFTRHKSRHHEGGISHDRPDSNDHMNEDAQFLPGGSQDQGRNPSIQRNANPGAYSEPQSGTFGRPISRESTLAQTLLTPDASDASPLFRDVIQPSTTAQPSQQNVYSPAAPLDFSSNNLLGDRNNDNFAAWLFDSPNSHQSAFEFDTDTIFDFGIDFGTNNNWAFDEPGLLNSRTYSASTIMTDQLGVHHAQENMHTHISCYRRDVLIAWLSSFMRKKKLIIEPYHSPESLLLGAESYEWPNLTSSVLENCIAAFWTDISSQMPILHQATFSANTCEPLLLFGIVALGAAAIVRSRPAGTLRDYKAFADFVATNLRWEVFTNDDAQPPVQLWVAQTLLFVEFYEKMFSTRQLHERAHIHHTSTLTLLRRGSPMIGQSGSDTPVSETPTRPSSPAIETETVAKTGFYAGHSWWKRWVSRESMNRVVFAAFQMDTLHACLFGHSADILPHELRLQLPCDDSLWTAKTAEEVHRLESTFAMYKIKQINFLDGLKRGLHRYDVQTHHYARMTLMVGLMSVGWHLDRREKQLQFVETAPSAAEQARWRSLLLQAFGHWRRNFSEALDSSHLQTLSGKKETPQEMSGPTILYHTAHLTMHVDIIDCQILSGSRRLLGRKVSEKDRATVLQRMRSWARSPWSRHAVLHAFKVLEITFCDINDTTYSCRNDPSVYRPWMLYLAGLTIWAYHFASITRPSTTINSSRTVVPHFTRKLLCEYIKYGAAVDNEDRIPLVVSTACCFVVLQALSEDLATAEAEILVEASKRLQECTKMLSRPD